MSNTDTSTEAKVETEPKAEVKVEAQPRSTSEVKAEVASKTEAKAETQAPAPAPAPKPDWREERIAQLTARLRAAEEAAKKAQPVESPKAPTSGPSQAEIEQQVNERASQMAAQLAAQRVFADKADEVAKKGRAAFPDFDEKVKNITSKLVDAQDPASVQRYWAFVNAAMETGQAEALLHDLGTDLDEANRLMNLDPVRMGMELAWRTMPARQEVEVSSLPKPIVPVGSKGPSHTEIDPSDPERASKLEKNEWFRRRQAQVDARNKEGLRSSRMQ